MTRHFLTLLICILFSSVAFSQTIIHTENFSGTVTKISTNTPSTPTWSLSTLNQSSHLGASGGNNYRSSGSGTTRLFLEDVSTINYTNIRISWAGRRVSGTNELRLYYKVGNGNYTEITGFTGITANSTWAKINGGSTIALPADAANASSLSLRWNINIGTGDVYSIDDIIITGTPIAGISPFSWNARPNNENPFTVSGPTAPNPYTLDGVTMRMSRTSGSGVNLTTSVVSSATFQTPIRTLTLIQTGATTTRGTVVTTDFSAPVSGVTFTMFDVDRSSGQYQDIIKIEGSLAGSIVNLAKTNVVTTSYNQFVEGTNTVMGLPSGVDAPSNSIAGNVTVTIPEQIDKLVISYYNGDASSGNQGVGIQEMSWAKYIAPLPVELISFTGKLSGNTNELNWITASEKNNSGFAIERSSNGKSFESIGEVKGQGTTSSQTLYRFNDTKAFNGLSYYRLKQIDFEGQYEYSKIIAIDNNTRFTNSFSVYPNPAEVELTIAFNGNTQNLKTWKIMNVLGEIVKQDQISGNNQGQPLNISVVDLQAGVYTIFVEESSKTKFVKFIKK